MQFSQLKLSPTIQKAIKDKGYTSPTPIQEQSIPAILEGRDLLGCAQTGTGKTAAFAIPTLERLSQARGSGDWGRGVKALIVTPTRELAIQIDESFTAYGKGLNLKNTVIFGGVKQHAQVKKLKEGVDILVATPGRLNDLINQGYIKLDTLKIFTLDEADRMLDMGFIHDVKKIIAKIPRKRQTLFFSATMPQAILGLANSLLTNPKKVEVAVVSSTADTVTQKLYYVDRDNKRALLHHVLQDPAIPTALVFTRTKYGADKLVRFLDKAGIKSAAIHGNKSQNARQAALQKFKEKKLRVLVATDIAARGIDINELSHVINFEIPNEPETYVHRIGRTGRAKNSGIAMSFSDREEKKHVAAIHKLINKKIPTVNDHPFPMGSTIVQVPGTEGTNARINDRPKPRSNRFRGNQGRR
jgi:ATP-dependent RNA helicase RhlE